MTAARTPKRHWLLFAVGGAAVVGLGRIIERASEDTVVWVSAPVSLVLFGVIYLAASTAGREALTKLVIAAGEATGKVVSMTSGGLLGMGQGFGVTFGSKGGAPTPEEEAGAAGE